MKKISSFFKCLVYDKYAKIGFAILAVLVLFAIYGQIFIQEIEPDYGNILKGPSLDHLLGTDFSGRDTLKQFVLGSKDVLLIAFFAGFFTILIGIVFGIFSGVIGGKIDSLFMLITNVVLTVPSFPVLMVLSMVVNATNPITFGLLLSLWSWAGLARSIRAQILSLKNSEFIEASHVLGLPTSHIVVHDILPSLISFIVVNFVLIMRSSILASVGLMMLGLATFKGEHWGIMLNMAMGKSGAIFGSEAMIYLVVPIVGIIIFQVACFMLSKGLEDSFDPRVRSEMND